VKKIVSGGQTGADLAAIDWAIANNVPYEIRTFVGFKPVNDRSFDYRHIHWLPAHSSYVKSLRARTLYNILNSDCTFIFLDRPIASTRGTRLTRSLCEKHSRPFQIVPIPASRTLLSHVSLILKDFDRFDVINCAGPRSIDEESVRKALDLIAS